MRRAERAPRDDEGGRSGPDSFPTKFLRGGRINAPHQPRQTGQLNVLVVLPQQQRTSERRGQARGSVDYALNDRGVVMIRRGHGIGAQYSHSQRPAFESDGEDLDRVIVLDRLGNLSQVRSKPLAVKLSLENFR